MLLDYEDFLRQNGLRQWDKDSQEAITVRKSYRADMSDKSDLSDPYSISTAGPGVAANTLICLINQASYLLARQIHYLEQRFLNHGGFTERLYHHRRRERNLL